MKEKRKMSLNKDNKKSYKGNVGIVIRKILYNLSFFCNKNNMLSYNTNIPKDVKINLKM